MYILTLRRSHYTRVLTNNYTRVSVHKKLSSFFVHFRSMDETCTVNERLRHRFRVSLNYYTYTKQRCKNPETKNNLYINVFLIVFTHITPPLFGRASIAVSG